MSLLRSQETQKPDAMRAKSVTRLSLIERSSPFAPNAVLARGDCAIDADISALPVKNITFIAWMTSDRTCATSRARYDSLGLPHRPAAHLLVSSLSAAPAVA